MSADTASLDVTSQRERRSPRDDREQLLERLQKLRAILPVFAQEVTSVRRQAAELRVQNRSLIAEVGRLQRARDADPRRKRA